MESLKEPPLLGLPQRQRGLEVAYSYVLEEYLRSAAEAWLEAKGCQLLR
jgi:hypothetical protein